MIDLKTAKAIYLYPGSTDMRLGIFGLIRKVKDPVRDCAYVFCGKNRMTLKILFYQGSSIWLCQKRLFRGKFVWPASGEVANIDDDMLKFLVFGADKINSIELEGKDIQYTLF